MNSAYVPYRMVDAVNDALESRIKQNKQSASELKHKIGELRLNKQKKEELLAICDKIIFRL